MITWIIDKHVDRLRGVPTPFAEKAQERGHIVYGLRDSILSKPINLAGISLAANATCLIRGSHGFVNYVEAELSATPGGFLHPTNFKPSVYNTNIVNFALNPESVVMKYNDFEKKRSTFSGDIFVKPAEDIKAFTGLVLQNGENLEIALHREFGKIVSIPSSCLVSISEAVDIQEEYRVVVVDGEPVTGSLYDNGNFSPIVPDDIFETARQVDEVWKPAPVYVVDICKTLDGNKVVEYNQFSTSAMYACDQDKIIESLENYL